MWIRRPSDSQQAQEPGSMNKHEALSLKRYLADCKLYVTCFFFSINYGEFEILELNVCILLEFVKEFVKQCKCKNQT